MPTSPMDSLDLDKFRKVVRSCIERVRRGEEEGKRRERRKEEEEEEKGEEENMAPPSSRRIQIILSHLGFIIKCGVFLSILVGSFVCVFTYVYVYVVYLTSRK